MLAPYLWYHLLYNKTYIFVLGVLASYCMRTKEGRHHLYRCRLLYALYHAQHLQLVFSVKAVAALYLNAARTLHHHLAHTPHGLLIELVLCHGVQQVGRVEYASAALAISA